MRSRHQRTLKSGQSGLLQINERASQRAVREVFRGLCALADSPVSLGLWLLYENKDFKSLVEYDPTPLTSRNYKTAHEFALDWQCAHFFKKCENLETGIDKTAVAIQKWHDAEQLCRSTNEIFRKRWSGSLVWEHDVEEVWYLARCKVRQILGSFDIDLAREHCRFGPKSDLGTRDGRVARFHKYKTPGHISPTCEKWMHDAFGPLSDEGGTDVRLHLANRARHVEHEQVLFVPKDAKTERAISQPPRWNLFCQLGVGSLIQSRLLKVGVDIRDQSRNQHLASVAKHRCLATVDLSSASDTMASNTVIDFLAECDPYWLHSLLSLRSSYALVPSQEGPGTRVRLEKLSAMGNGFTFPLQTLLFYCVAWGASKHLGVSAGEIRQFVSAYGDDIIVPSRAYDLLSRTLRAIGFKVNPSKSFADGDFYESCGTDWFRSQPVRPFFLRKTPSTVQEMFTLLNGISGVSLQLGDPKLGLALRQVWNLRQPVLACVPRDLRLFGPSSLGDSVIHAPLEQALQAGTAVPSWISVKKHAPQAHNSYVGLYHCQALVEVDVGEAWTGASSFYPHIYSKLGSDTHSGNRVSRRGPEWTATKRKTIEFVPYGCEIGITLIG